MIVRILMALIVAAALPAVAAFAQSRTINPSIMALEYRAAVEKRVAELKKLASCQNAAATKKFSRGTAPDYSPIASPNNCAHQVQIAMPMAAPPWTFSRS